MGTITLETAEATDDVRFLVRSAIASEIAKLELGLVLAQSGYGLLNKNTMFHQNVSSLNLLRKIWKAATMNMCVGPESIN